MKKLYNLTSLNQARHVKAYKRAGFDIEVKPRIKYMSLEIPRCVKELEQEGKRAAREIPDGSHVLVSSSIIYELVIVEAASIDLLRKGCTLYVAHVERKTAQDGGFVFNLRDFSETPLSKRWKKQ
jgi:hypothetical protein